MVVLFLYIMAHAIFQYLSMSKEYYKEEVNESGGSHLIFCPLGAP